MIKLQNIVFVLNIEPENLSCLDIQHIIGPKKIVFDIFVLMALKGCGQSNSLWEHFLLKLSIVSCFSGQKTSILTYHMSWVSENYIFDILAQKWVWSE